MLACRSSLTNRISIACQLRLIRRSSAALYRIREGNYRIIYTIRDNELVILVVKIGDRKEVYR
ncbi:MAG: type II toxin-antitoxin system RelE/ParE family toxin [Nitrospira sp.]|nr:type II toxin-antitoxin system RelE/ParE family toxin [Nitrospira sp.]